MAPEPTSLELTVATRLGPVRILADDRGLTRIVLPGGEARESQDGQKSGSAHPLLQEAARQISAYLAGRRTTFALPLAFRGTPFQRRVWGIIARIPYGQTMTYSAIARELGGAGKARAVGAAAGANPLPLVIPCHRVIGADGSLTGFAGGLALKAELLRLEQVPGPGTQRAAA